MSTEIIIVAIASAIASACGVYIINLKSKTSKPKGEEEAGHTIPKPDTAQAEILIESAKNKAKQIVLEAKDEVLKIREKAEEDTKNSRVKLLEDERRIVQKLEEISQKTKEFKEKEDQVKKLKDIWQQKNSEIDKLRQKQIDKLENISSLTKEEAKKLILTNLEKSLQNDVVRKIKESEESVLATSAQKAREILVDAMQHASTDYVAEYTISTIKLADEEIKGRIIGKEGRNIKAFEDMTGVNVDFEESGEIRLSSFDSVRREIARISMEKLIKDGRIHPGRIEEIVKRTEIDMDRIILEAGEELCQKVGIFNLPKEIVKKLGNFKYRTSYGQNMIQHTLEETKIGVKIATEIGADVAITKVACLLHDIGKVITDKEGNHIELGAEFLKKFNLPQAIITAVSEHHEDKPSTLEGVIVQIADSISGSRPGARYEDYEAYVKRMRNLEDAAKTFEGIEKVFAISAGREIRVIVKPEEINDVEAVKLSHDIANKIQSEQTFPGTVKVIVIRETRSVATAT